MQILGTITPGEIEATCIKHACKFFSVEDLNSRKLVSNNKGNDIAGHVNLTIQRINAVPENTFKLTIISALKGTNKATFNYYLQKAANAPQVQQPTIIHNGTDPARSLSEAVKDARELATLQSEKTRLEDEIARIKADYSALVAEQEQEELKSLEETSAEPQIVDKIGGFLKDILPSFMPLAEKYLDIRQQQVNNETMKVQRSAPAPVLAPARPKHPFRPLPQIGEIEKIEAYLSWLERVPEHIFNKEIEVLEISAPDLCAIVKDTFINNEENEQANTQE